MQNTFFHLEITSAITGVKGETLLFEIESQKDIEALTKIPFESRLISQIQKDFKAKKSFSYTTFSPMKKFTTCIIASRGKEDFFSFFGKTIREIKGDIAFKAATWQDFFKRMDALVLSSYTFTRYLEEKKQKAKKLILIANTHGILEDQIQDRIRLLESVYLARNLVNTPSCDKYPEKLKDIILELPWERTKLEVLDQKKMESLSFGCLLGVAKGSDNTPYSVILHRAGTLGKKRALVGKWVTFDAGGVQIKPEDSMEDMKSDMAGAAALVATMWYLDNKETIPYSLVAGVGLVENMLGGSAMKPLDILTAHSGKTVEIHHTDAEWRLVLADLVAYLTKKEKPESTITIATLTGACISALGYNYAGMIGNDAKLKKDILSAAKNTEYERFFELPFDTEIQESVKGEISDYTNYTKNVGMGASLGAAFVSKFVEHGKFVHLDIAGPAYRSKAYSVFPENGTGFAVATLAGLLGE